MNRANHLQNHANLGKNQSANLCGANRLNHANLLQNRANLNANPTNPRDFGILHLATKYIPTHTERDIVDLIDSNIAFGAEILEASLRFKPKFFINILTFSQFANSAAYAPSSFYDSTKQAFFDIIELYKNAHRTTKFIHILLYNTYGANDSRPKILNLWDKASRSGEALEMSAGAQIIDISHIDDITRGLNLAIAQIDALDAQKIYTLENANRPTLRELANIFSRTVGRKLNIKWGAKPYRANEIMRPICASDSSAFEILPNYKPQIPLEKGIKRVFG